MCKLAGYICEPRSALGAVYE